MNWDTSRQGSSLSAPPLSTLCVHYAPPHVVHCIEKVQLYRETGVEQLLCLMQNYGILHEKTMQSIRLWARKLFHVANRVGGHRQPVLLTKGGQTWRQSHVPSIRRRSKPVANAFSAISKAWGYRQ